MGEHVHVRPAADIQGSARRQEAETGLGVFGAALPDQHRVEPPPQRMQVEHVSGGVGELRRRQLVRAPIRGLLRLDELDPEKFAAPPCVGTGR